MKSNLRVLSIAAFAAAVPALVITDWYYKGYGLFAMFLLLTVGLLLDQIIRMEFPAGSPAPTGHYRKNRLLNMVALTLFVQAPVGLIYGNQCRPRLGFWLLVIMVCAGICANQIAKLKYPYKTQNKEETL